MVLVICRGACPVRINLDEGPGHLARVCADAGAVLIHLSTDYVFSGDFGAGAPRPYDTDDPADPISVYGRTKLAGEQAVLAAGADAYVVRTAPFYTPTSGGSLLDQFRTEWITNQAAIPRDIAHLMTGEPGSVIEYGGLAYVGFRRRYP